VWVQVPPPAPPGKGLEPFRALGLFPISKTTARVRGGSKLGRLANNNRHRFIEQCRLLKICLGGFCMPDYKAMYYHLAGRMATAIDALEATTNALVDITEKLKLAQQTTEEMFISSSDDDVDSPDNISEKEL
jgi:hypothetical protein